MSADLFRRVVFVGRTLDAKCFANHSTALSLENCFPGIGLNADIISLISTRTGLS
jgi:hypothetical protein